MLNIASQKLGQQSFWQSDIQKPDFGKQQRVVGTQLQWSGKNEDILNDVLQLCLITEQYEGRY